MSKPNLLLLPGLPGKGELFGPLIEELGDRFESVPVSYPDNEPLGYGELFNLVTSCIEREKKYFILGESFSGPLAVMAAARYPENVAGLVMAATFVTSPMPRWIDRLKPLLNTPLMDFRPRPYINDRLMGKNCPEKTRRWIHQSLPRLGRDVVAARVKAVLEVNVREELKACRVPVLYLAGARDWLIGKKCIDTVWLCRPDVEIRVIDGVHMILQTNPKDAAQAINEFCGHIF